MKDSIFSGVVPERRAEVARRVAIIERYIALPDPLKSDAQAHAAEIGVGVAQFGNLVRIWREYKRPDLIGGAPRRSARVKRTLVGPRAQAIISKAIAAADKHASPSDIARSANAVLQRRGLPTVNDETVRRRLAPSGTTTVERRHGWLALDEVALELPVALDDDGRARPLLHLAFDLETARIHVWRVAKCLMRDEDAAALLLMAIPEVLPVGIHLSAANFRESAAIRTDLIAAGIECLIDQSTSIKIGNVTRHIIGDMLGPVKLRATQKRGLRTPTPSEPIALSVAVPLIDAIVIAHNSKCPVSSVQAKHRVGPPLDELVAKLSAIAGNRSGSVSIPESL